MRWTGMVVFAAVLATAAYGDVTVAEFYTYNDAQADCSAGKYADGLHKIAVILASTTPPTGQDKADLLLLKAECLLQEKQSGVAADAFAAAAAAYPAKNKTGAATASATSTLIKKSADFQYTPVTAKDKTPLPILPVASRPAAFTALFNDEMATAQTTDKTLLAKPNLPPIVEFAPTIHDLDMLEIAASGSDTKTAAMEQALADHAKTAIDQAITTMNTTADGIATNAATMINKDKAQGGTGRRNRQAQAGQQVAQQQQQQQPQDERGLNDSDKTKLNDMETTLEKIPPATKTLQTALGSEADFYKTENANADALKKKVQTILGGQFKNLPKVGS